MATAEPVRTTETDVSGGREDEIRSLVTRLGRPDPSGGTVVERAAIMAAGVDFTAVIAWIVAHGGEPEARVAVATGGGLHSARVDRNGGAGSQTPRRYVLPADALR
jgi:hypothetical protein